jgi:O-antigen/teichoic acid export membrane protein
MKDYQPKIFALFTVVMLIIVIGSSLINYYANVLLARYLGTAAFGNYTVIKEVIAIGSVILLLGCNYSVVRFLPEYFNKADYALARGYIKHNYVKIFSLGFGVFLLGIALAILYGAKISWLAFLWVIPLLGFATYWAEMLRGMRHIFWATFLLMFLCPLLFVVFILCCSKHGVAITLFRSFALYAVALVITCGLQFFIVHKNLRSKIRNVKARYVKKLWSEVSWQLLAINLVLMVLFSSEVILLKIFGHNAQTVGQFSAVLTICSLYWLIFNAVTFVMVPYINPTVLSGDNKKMQSLMSFGVSILLIMVLALSFIIFEYRYFILYLFGDTYLDAVGPMLIVMFGYGVAVVLGLPWFFLSLTGLQNKLLKPVLILLCLNIFGTAICVHYFDIWGCALCLALTDVFLVLWQAVLVKRYLGISVLCLPKKS